MIDVRYDPLLQAALVAEATDSLLAGQAAIFGGAGISMFRQSRLPGWMEMICALLEQIAGPSGRREFRFVTSPRNNYMELLFNEQALQLMTEVLGLDSIERALTSCLDAPNHSRSHRMFAWAHQQCGASLLTTNFDELIERAGVQSGHVLKMHGTLSCLSKARFTVNKVFSPLEHSLLRDTKNCLLGRTLVVLGYGGEDEFDVVPALLNENDGPSRVIWVVHFDGRGSPPPLSDSVQRRFEAWGKKAIALAADTDSFIEQIYQTSVARDAALADPELADWQCKRLRTARADWGWWKGGVRAWGRQLRRTRTSDVCYLWARILEHLRIYQVKGPRGGVRNFAVDAFVRFRNCEEVSAERLLDADARLAAIRRTIGKPDLHEFATIVRRIKSAIQRTSNPKRRRSLKLLLGRTQQQFATAYFGVGLDLASRRHMLRARQLVNEAITFRKAIKDLEAPYSLFQQFIMAYYIAKNGLGDFDDFAPRHWESQLLPKLKGAAATYRRLRQPEHCGTMQHNVAFVYQVLAERLQAAGKQKESRAMFLRSISWCEKGRTIRIRLRDPRMIAQSEVRIAQCKLALARLAVRMDIKERHIADAELRITEAKRLYDRTPQETHRLEDVHEVVKEIASLQATGRA